MLQNDEPFFLKPNLMQKLRHDGDQLQNEKKEYKKYQTYLNKEIKDLFSKNEQLLSCFISHKKIYEDLELRNNKLEERIKFYQLEESRSKKVKARLTQIKNKQDPIYPSRVLIPMENNTENQYIQLSNEYQVLESKISEINIDSISDLLEEKQKLEEKHIKLKKEAAELMSLLDKPENKLSKKSESLFYHMLHAMDECDKNRKKLFVLKHGSQNQIDDLKLDTEDNKDETIDLIDLLKTFPDIQPSQNLQELINEEIELKKRKDAKRKRIEAMKKKDEEFLRNLNHRQRPNYYQIRPPSQKKGSNPNASISDSGERNKNDQINRLRMTLNNHYAALKNSNQKKITVTSPTEDNSLLPAQKKNGRRKINSKQILIGNSIIEDDQLIEKSKLDQANDKLQKFIKKRRRKHSSHKTNSMLPKKHTINIQSSEFASSSSTSAARKREENLLLSLNQNKDDNINYDIDDDKKNDHEDQENDHQRSSKNDHHKDHKSSHHKDHKNHNQKVHKKHDERTYQNENKDENDEDIEGKLLLDAEDKLSDSSSSSPGKNKEEPHNDEANYQLLIQEEEEENNSETESTNGNTFEFEQTLELDSRWRFHVDKDDKNQENPKEEPTSQILHIDHNPKQFVEEESNKEDYSKTEFLQEVELIEEEEEIKDGEEEQIIEKIIIHKKKTKHRRKHKHNDDVDIYLNLTQKENKNNDIDLIKSNHRKSEKNRDDKTISADEFDYSIKTKPQSARRSNSVKTLDSKSQSKRRSNSIEIDIEETQNNHKRKRRRKHRSKSIDPTEKDENDNNQEEEEESNPSQNLETISQKIAFKLLNQSKKNSQKSSSQDETKSNSDDENKTQKLEAENNSNSSNNNETKKPLKKEPIKKKRLLNLDIAKKPVIIDEQKSTIENLSGKPHRSHSNHKSRHHQSRESNRNNNTNNNSSNSNNKETGTKAKDDDYYDDNSNENDGYPSDKNYEYNYEYDYEFDDKDYYSNDNKRSKKRRHGHHYRRKTNRRFYTHHPRHHHSHSSNHHQSSRNNRYSTQRPSNIRKQSRSRKSYDDEEEEQRKHSRSRRPEPRRVRRHYNDYYSNSSDYYSDDYGYNDNDNDYDYGNSDGYNTVSDDYEYEIHEETIFAPLDLQISKDYFIHEEKEKLRNPRVFQRKIIPKQQTQQGSEKSSLLSMSLKTGNDPTNPENQKQIKESKTFSQLNNLNDFVIHEPNEAFESLRKKGKGEQLDLEISQTREKLAKMNKDIIDLQKKLKSSLLKESSTQVDEPFSMASLSAMKDEIKNNQNLDDLINQAKKQRDLLEQELPNMQDRLNDLQKQYVRKAATLRHYKQIKEELDEQHFFLINASKKQIKKLNDLDEQIRRGRRRIEIIDGRIADIRNIIDLKTKELSIKASKKRPNVVGMCDKFKRDRFSEKEIMQLIDYHDIERQYLEKAIESISYQLSDDSLTKKEFEIERIVIIAQKLKEKYFEKRGMSNQTMITITNEEDLNALSKKKTLTREEIHSTMMQIDLVISQIQKQISQLSNKNIEVPPPPSSFLNLQALKKSKLETQTSLL